MRNPSTELPCILRVGEINDNPAALLPSYPAAQLTLSRVTRRNVNTEPHSPFVGFGSSEKRISFILNGIWWWWSSVFMYLQYYSTAQFCCTCAVNKNTRRTTGTRRDTHHGNYKNALIHGHLKAAH